MTEGKECCRGKGNTGACPCGLMGKMMSCCPSNVGQADRIIRAVVGLVLIALVFVGPQTPWGWIGLVPLASAALGWCGLYTVLGVNTASCCKGQDKTGGACCSKTDDTPAP